MLNLYFPKFRPALLLLLYIWGGKGTASGQTAPQAAPFQSSPLTYEGNLSSRLLEEAHGLIEQKIKEAPSGRARFWNRDFSGAEAYNRSVTPNRKRLMKYLGIEDKTTPPSNYNLGLPDIHPQAGMEFYGAVNAPALVAETPVYRVYQVRWPVLDRVNGEGLLIQPKNKPVAHAIVLPDADQTPEQLAGLAPGLPSASQMARQLAENGVQVLIPVIIDRSPVVTGKPFQQSRREWIYRQAFHMGRHIIGYEVQKVLAAVDWLSGAYGKDLKIGVAGYLEGGLIAFYAAALDTRIDAALISGYFQSRQKLWNEPIYRSVWGLLEEFGDAEIAALIAPRPLVVEYSRIPEIWDGPKPGNPDAYKYTGFKGKIETPAAGEVKEEFRRVDGLVKAGFQKRELVTGPDGQAVDFGSPKAMAGFASFIGHPRWKPAESAAPVDLRKDFNAGERQFRQAKELDEHVQNLLRISDYDRNQAFLDKLLPEIRKRTWSTRAYHPYHAPDSFIVQTRPYREQFAEEIIGRFTDPLTAPRPESRQIYDSERWTGHEVLLKVYDHFSAAGVLLLPKDLKPGEKRPAVVLQHGRNGVPEVVIKGSTSYNNMGALLADKGFIVFVPYGLYNGEDRYRWLDRKANGLRKTLFSFVLAQHEQILNWLNTLPQVDPKRIAFYGKSYGGEMAMRIPSILEGYCLSICSGDFGDWSRKVADTRYYNSFMYTIEWEMPYFNMGRTFSYAEMAYLIFPRPFMVERGHDDLVQPDEWVASEYAKVRYLYDRFNMGDRTDIEFFNGGHASRNEGTFRFLHRHLNWP